MPTFAQVANNSAHITFKWQGLEFQADYVPGKLTDAVWTQIDAGPEERNAALALLVSAWDAQEEDGSVMPIDADHLAALPVSFKLALSLAIMGDVRPN